MSDWRPSRRDLVVAVVLLFLAALGVLLAFLLSRGNGAKATFDLDAAYKAAAPGATICIPAGDYGGLAIYDDPNKDQDTRPVTVAPCNSGNVSAGRLDIGNSQLGLKGPSHVIVRDMRIDFWRATEGSRDVEVRNVKGSGFGIVTADSYTSFGGPPDNVRVIGGEYGPCEVPAKLFCTNIVVGKNLVIDGAWVHDVTSTDLANYHVDGIFFRGCDNCTIRNSRFDGNMITNLRVQNCCQLPDNRNIHLGPGNFWGYPLEGDNKTTRADCIDVDNITPGFTETGDTYEPKCGPSADTSRWPPGQVFQGSFASSKFLNVGPCIVGATYSGNTTLPWNYRTTGTAVWDGSWGNAPCGDSVKATQPWPYNPPDLSWPGPGGGGTTTAPTTAPTTTVPTTTVPTTAPIPPSTTTVISTVTLPPVTVTQPPTTVTVGTNSLCKPSDPTRANPDYLCKPAP